MKKEYAKATIAIDASSSSSGLALYLDGEFQQLQAVQINHQVKDQYKDQKDALQYEMAGVSNVLVSFLLIKVKPAFINLVVEEPKGSYTNNRTLSQIRKYVGLWIGCITSALIIMGWDMINNFKLYTPDAKKWRSLLPQNLRQQMKNRSRDEIKEILIQKAEDLTKLDLHNYKQYKRDIHGNIERDKQGNNKFRTIVADDLAEAIVMAWIYDKITEIVNFDKLGEWKELKHGK